MSCDLSAEIAITKTMRGPASKEEPGISDRPMTRHWRLATIMSAALLASCTPDVPLAEYVPPSAPSPAKALEGARKATDKEKLVGLIERSEVREADPPRGPGRYVLWRAWLQRKLELLPAVTK
jgi:hypothetical protein